MDGIKLFNKINHFSSSSVRSQISSFPAKLNLDIFFRCDAGDFYAFYIEID